MLNKKASNKNIMVGILLTGTALLKSPYVKALALDVLEIEPTEFRSLVYSLVTNILLYIGIPIYLFALLFLGEDKQNHAMYLVLGYTSIAIFISIWLFVFNRNPRIPIVKVTLTSDGVLVSSLTNEEYIQRNQISSYQISGGLNKQIMINDTHNRVIKISYYLFKREQRSIILDYLSSICAE